MKIKIINNTDYPDPTVKILDMLNIQQLISLSTNNNTLYISHTHPSDPENWVEILKSDILNYVHTHDLFYKTSIIGHRTKLYRKRSKSNEINYYSKQVTVPVTSKCTCSRPTGHHICYSCEHYEASLGTCERYPVSYDLSNVTKLKCGEYEEARRYPSNS